MKVSDKFTVAAAFGNVHGVYKPGNVDLQPKILKNSQIATFKKNLAHHQILLILYFTEAQAHLSKILEKLSDTV